MRQFDVCDIGPRVKRHSNLMKFLLDRVLKAYQRGVLLDTDATVCPPNWLTPASANVKQGASTRSNAALISAAVASSTALIKLSVRWNLQGATQRAPGTPA